MPQGRRGTPAAGAGKNILLQAGAGRPLRAAGLAGDRFPGDWGDGSGRGGRRCLTCAASSFVSCSDLGRIWTFFGRWRRHPRNLRKDRQRLWAGARSPPESSQAGPGPPAPLPPPAPAEDFVAIAPRTGPDASRSLQRGPRAAPDPVRAARADSPEPGKVPGRDRALALASLHQSRLLRLLLPRC